MKRIIFGIMLMLLLMAMFSLLIYYIKPTKAGWTGTVYIRADGSIDPQDAPIITYDKVTYRLTNNIISSANGIVIERDNILLDGMNCVVEGTTSFPYEHVGIDLTRRTNITIKDFNIHRFYNAIYLSYSSKTVISGNSLINNTVGIHLDHSWSNYVFGNSIINSLDGIYLEYSSDNVISRNSMTSYIHGIGIAFEFSSYNNIFENSVTNYDYGIVFYGSLNNNVHKNSITNNAVFRVDLRHYSSNNNISENYITNNAESGIHLEYSSRNIISENDIANNLNGVIFEYSSDTSVYGNSIANNGYGLHFGYSTCNDVFKNSIANNGYGVYLFCSTNSRFCYNNFIDNNRQVYDAARDNPNVQPSTNIYDSGYPSGGNYWSDYIGVDLYGGPNQNITGNDGIGDTPYIINSNNIDGYPLMAPFKAFEAGVWNGRAYNVDVVSNSTVSDFRFNVDQKSIDFNVTGDDGTIGFCRVAIPKSLLWVDDGWTILINSQPITDYTRFEDENYTYIYFTYSYSTQTVIIQGTHAIPEYPSAIILTMFMLATTILVVLIRNRKLKHG